MAISPLAISLDNLIIQAYFGGQAAHREISLDQESFSARLNSIIEKHLGRFPSPDIATKFFESLFTGDLYLSVACSESNDSAWRRFDSMYRKQIYNVAIYFCSVPGWAREFTDGIMAELFLPDRRGRSRIAGFEGRSSLGYWLAAIVKHRAINEGSRKRNSDEPIESVSDRVDLTFLDKADALLRARRYGSIINDSFKRAQLNLNQRERLITRLHYENGMKLIEIANLLGESSSTITRKLQALHRKLHSEIISDFRERYKLSEESIEECLAVIMENPEHSFLRLIASE